MSCSLPFAGTPGAARKSIWKLPSAGKCPQGPDNPFRVQFCERPPADPAADAPGGELNQLEVRPRAVGASILGDQEAVGEGVSQVEALHVLVAALPPVDGEELSPWLECAQPSGAARAEGEGQPLDVRAYVRPRTSAFTRKRTPRAEGGQGPARHDRFPAPPSKRPSLHPQGGDPASIQARKRCTCSSSQGPSHGIEPSASRS